MQAGNITAGNSFPLTVTVKDVYGNTATGYSGAIHFTSSDRQAVLPADYTFASADQGVHTFTATLETAGTQSITATDTTDASVSGSETGITVTPAAAASLIFSNVPSSTTAGNAFTVTLAAIDAYGNVVDDYSGTVHFTTSDPESFLPADYTFASAEVDQHSFAVTLVTAGTQSLTGTDTRTNSLTATASGIVVAPAAAASLNISGLPASVAAGTAYPITVRAVDVYGNTASGYTGTVHFTSSDPQAVLPGDYAFTTGDNSTHTFTNAVPFGTVGTQTLTATDKANSKVKGTATVQVAKPSIASLSPNTVAAGSSDLTLTITGTGFEPLATVTFGATTLAPSSVSGTTELAVTIPASLLTTPGNVGVTVNNPVGSGVGASTVSSAPATFTITAPAPSPSPSPSGSPSPGGGKAPTITTIVNVSNQYPGLFQLETITVAVTNPSGVVVDKGVAAIQVDGQTVYAAVQDGVATATVATGLLDFSLWMDLLFAHTLTASYSEGIGAFGSSSASTSAAPILLDFFLYEITQQLRALKSSTRAQFQDG
jgi:hypothetical protein